MSGPHFSSYHSSGGSGTSYDNSARDEDSVEFGAREVENPIFADDVTETCIDAAELAYQHDTTVNL